MDQDLSFQRKGEEGRTAGNDAGCCGGIGYRCTKGVEFTRARRILSVNGAKLAPQICSGLEIER